jgi:hypothetical protein
MNASLITHGILSQFLAAIDTLKDCIDRCPEGEWDERHDDYPFCQVAFHTLFDCDYHLCDKDEDFKAQPFHKENGDIFADYEGLEDFPPLRLYERVFIDKYYDHCRQKAISIIEPKTIEELTAPQSDVRKNMTKLERYVNIARHTQHHAAQLALTLQLLTGEETEWISWGNES